MDLVLIFPFKRDFYNEIIKKVRRFTLMNFRCILKKTWEKTMKYLLVLVCFSGISPYLFAIDVLAGKAKVETVCAACHGASGVSVSDSIPHLAGQRAGYLESQLKALKDGSRKNAIMNPIAGQLSPDDIKNIAAFFASQPGASAGAKSEFLPSLAKTNASFPDNYQQTYKKYLTLNFPATKQVRYYYANPIAVNAIKTNKSIGNGAVLFVEVFSAKLDTNQNPVMGTNGFYEPNQLLFYTSMESGDGWGKAVPEILRNGDWNYAVFTADKKIRPTANQAECFACHKPLENTNYLFTTKNLITLK
jgi:cytochrome c553